MPIRFATSDTGKKEHFAYWREAVCDAYVLLGCESDKRRDFNGEIVLERLSKLSVSFVSGTTQEVYRRRRDIARSSDDYFLLSLQLENEGLVAQGGRTGHLRPGDFALYSSTDPYHLTLADDFRQLVLQVPRTSLLQRLPNADLLTGRTVRGDKGVGALVSSSLVSFAKNIGSAGRATQPIMQDTVVDLMATGLASLEDSAFELSLPEQNQLVRARAFIQSNLDNPDLDRNAVARAAGLSVRRLNEIFARDRTSIAAEIRNARLDRIAQGLTDSRLSRQSITQIAIGCGVSNLQHFSKIFRERFGMPPSAYRKQAAKPPVHE